MLRLLVATTMSVALASAAAAAPAKKEANEKAAEGSEKLICKRFVETGSLVKGQRICKTKREWEIERDAIRSTVTGGGACNTGTGNC